ncbi:MAG: DUF4446 family protein [Chloroflexi bacterium]|nr:DUF4446 family protein [Chloroflexota bacterium]
MEGLAEVSSSAGLYLWLGLVAVTLGLVVWLLALHARVNGMSRHYRLLVRNVDGGNLEQILEKHLSHLLETSVRVDDLTAYCQEMDQMVRRAIQRVGVVRFNPFGDTGGDQSFSIALLDNAGNGVVISSLFSRTGNRIYAKSIQSGQSRHPLTAEEEQAIQQANSAAASPRAR